MEDLSLEDLIVDVVANPTPVRVSCQPLVAAPPEIVASPQSTGVYRTIRKLAGKIRRRSTNR
ncbi:MAG: hypothetical protein ABI862_21340 [Ilumatobacteraceae bacterium]